tara:strand:+ start:4342 stop:5088 length:747 start_codon:yes stop_codon:yes gene_type:complete
LDDELIVERDEDVLRLTLNRLNKANALNESLVTSLLSAVRSAAAEDTRLLTIRGAGDRFSGGFDLGGLDQEDDASLAKRFIDIETLLQEIYHAPFATLALVKGVAFGAGADLAGVCEQRIAAPGTIFRMPGLQFGVVLGTARFAHRVGTDTARAILVENRSFDAEQALEMGFLTGVADEPVWDILEERTAESARRLDPDVRAALNQATIPNTRAEDMAALRISVEQSGLKYRIQAYVAEFVTQRKSSG